MRFRECSFGKALFLIGLMISFVGCPVPLWAEIKREPEPKLDQVELRFLELINDYRQNHGKDCLVPSPTMNAAADYMSWAMGELGFFSHQEPPCDEGGNCRGRDPFDRITAFGHTDWYTSGENIAAGNPSAEATFEQWRTSPGHNANMLGGAFKSIGIARVTVLGSPYGVYWTTNFSDWIDGGGDCIGEGVDDYPIVGATENKSLTITEIGWCQAVPGQGAFLLGIGLLGVTWYRRWQCREWNSVEKKRGS